MKLVKLVGVLVAVAGVALLIGTGGPSVYGESGQGAPGDRSESSQPARRARELTILSGRGAEIGASIRDVDASGKAAGVVVEEVRPDSPAAKAGIRTSDVIVEFDGEAVRSARQFMRLVHETAPGRTVKATVMRDGARKDVQITPAEGRESVWFDGDRLRERLGDAWRAYEQMPPFNFDFDLAPPFDSRGRLGVSVQTLTSQLASYFGVKDGVLVTAVTEDGPAARAGLRAGDVITKVNGTPIRAREDLIRELRDIKDDNQATVGIVRDRKETSVTVKRSF